MRKKTVLTEQEQERALDSLFDKAAIYLDAKEYRRQNYELKIRVTDEQLPYGDFQPWLDELRELVTRANIDDLFKASVLLEKLKQARSRAVMEAINRAELPPMRMP